MRDFEAIVARSAEPLTAQRGRAQLVITIFNFVHCEHCARHRLALREVLAAACLRSLSRGQSVTVGTTPANGGNESFDR
jgi:hypothetical protein